MYKPSKLNWIPDRLFKILIAVLAIGAIIRLIYELIKLMI